MAEQGNPTMGKARETFRKSSPEELRERAKENVGKATAAATGSLEGYAEQAGPKAMGEAARKATQSVKEAATSVRDETKAGRSGSPQEPQTSEETYSGGV